MNVSKVIGSSLAMCCSNISRTVFVPCAVLLCVAWYGANHAEIQSEEAEYRLTMCFYLFFASMCILTYLPWGYFQSNNEKQLGALVRFGSLQSLTGIKPDLMPALKQEFARFWFDKVINHKQLLMSLIMTKLAVVMVVLLQLFTLNVVLYRIWHVYGVPFTGVASPIGVVQHMMANGNFHDCGPKPTFYHYVRACNRTLTKLYAFNYYVNFPFCIMLSYCLLIVCLVLLAPLLVKLIRINLKSFERKASLNSARVVLAVGGNYPKELLDLIPSDEPEMAKKFYWVFALLEFTSIDFKAMMAMLEGPPPEHDPKIWGTASGDVVNQV